MRIAVTTPTGNVGRHVTAMLIRAGLRPVLLARHPDRLPAEVHEHADVRQVDQGDRDAVMAATEGVDALFWVAPSVMVDDSVAEYERVGDDEMLVGLRGSGMPAGMAEAVLGMSTGLRDGFVPEQPRTVLTTTPTTLGAWAFEVLRPQLAR
ncbi:SDR family oxidoreductase [Nakamurella leprariae]|uniref:NAD(P)H-binding protein n=1 Tax=Nakamurella leprariae TaxID=2803911 RepID=A0A938YAY9_9ACTN|nr:NAD(P)H-binding protein [Nakamurella leprariae]MBM9466266.1 NAD(P)H-binding protein [Nakamurella leprariae]